MHHETTLITTMIAGIVCAFVLGALAVRLRAPALVGYLAAGVAIGPFTPGYIADVTVADQFAELGVIFLMFGVGLHFSLGDLLAARRIAVPGALGQMAAAILMGWGLGFAMGWSMAASLLFGLALSVASTVVLLKALEERGLIDSEHGRIAVGWLIVEDVAMIAALVLIPALAAATSEEVSLSPAVSLMGTGMGPAVALGLTVAKLAAFVGVMLVIGKRVMPWLLTAVDGSGSAELFRVAVLALALGSALGAALLFDVSVALGAFFAGSIIAETQFAKRADAESAALRDMFAVLFFVSVGMLFDPASVLRQPLALLATVAIIVLGKTVVAYEIVVNLLRVDPRTGVVIAASLAQIGEFSFILAEMGASLGVLPPEARDLILAGAVISIMLNPLAFRAAEHALPWMRNRMGSALRIGARRSS
jgi:CPA2 family monovalent cation:H+ antiporter-2